MSESKDKFWYKVARRIVNAGQMPMPISDSAPTTTLTSHLASINEQDCIACGICLEICPVGAPTILNDHNEVDIDRCLGCGCCIPECPENAISLHKTELRRVFIPPKRL